MYYQPNSGLYMFKNTSIRLVQAVHLLRDWEDNETTIDATLRQHHTL